MRDFRTETEEEMLARRAKKNDKGKAARAAETTAEKMERVEACQAEDKANTDDVKEETWKLSNATWAATNIKKRAAEIPSKTRPDTLLLEPRLLVEAKRQKAKVLIPKKRGLI